jgi:hypothetical protein
VLIASPSGSHCALPPELTQGKLPCRGRGLLQNSGGSFYLYGSTATIAALAKACKWLRDPWPAYPGGLRGRLPRSGAIRPGDTFPWNDSGGGQPWQFGLTRCRSGNDRSCSMYVIESKYSCCGMRLHTVAYVKGRRVGEAFPFQDHAKNGTDPGTRVCSIVHRLQWHFLVLWYSIVLKEARGSFAEGFRHLPFCSSPSPRDGVSP